MRLLDQTVLNYAFLCTMRLVKMPSLAQKHLFLVLKSIENEGYSSVLATHFKRKHLSFYNKKLLTTDRCLSGLITFRFICSGVELPEEELSDSGVALSAIQLGGFNIELLQKG